MAEAPACIGTTGGRPNMEARIMAMKVAEASLISAKSCGTRRAISPTRMPTVTPTIKPRP